MRVISFTALLLFAVGAVFLYQGLRVEGGQVYLVLIFPVFVLSGPLSFLGVLLIFFSLFLGFLSIAGFVPRGFFPRPGVSQEVYPQKSPTQEGRRRRWGGFLLLGPIPVVFGSDVKVTTAMLILAIVLTVTLIFLFI